MTEELVSFEKRGRVGIIILGHSGQASQVSIAMLREIVDAVAECEKDSGIGAILVAGSEKVFATGHDVSQMRQLDFPSALSGDAAGNLWEALGRHRKPMVAAVSGYAMGAGCDLALACDIVIASETAKFGQPEIAMGSMPAGGGLQRLARIVGRIKAMDMALTGRIMAADEAELAGLASRIVPSADLLDEAWEIAERVASMSLPLVLMVKDAVDAASESNLAEGLRYERRLFQESCGLADHREGLAAVVENRQPAFENK